MRSLSPTDRIRRCRFRQSRWFAMVWIVPVTAVVLAVLIVADRWFLHSAAGHGFLSAYPGKSALPDGTPQGFPGWLKWQHALNFFFIVLIIRAGWMIHVQRRPEAYWTRNNTGRVKTKRPPSKMSIYLWLHLFIDALWIPNGVIFGILLFATGDWKRLIPVHWDIFPNAVSAGLQYLSLDWPTNTPWVDYNALQVLAYFTIVFIAAPLAAITGIRMSPVWSSTWRISRSYPLRLARAIHLPVMFYFVVFIVVHVTLVFATGMRLNLNAMYSGAGQGSESWWGFAVFLVVLLVVIAGWIAARPIFMQPVASMTGRVTGR